MWNYTVNKSLVLWDVERFKHRSGSDFTEALLPQFRVSFLLLRRRVGTRNGEGFSCVPSLLRIFSSPILLSVLGWTLLAKVQRCLSTVLRSLLWSQN